MRSLSSRQKQVSEEKASDPQAAMDYVVRLLAHREYSEHEVYERLVNKGYQSDVIAQALERASGCGLLDDQRFAQGFIKSKSLVGWGRRRIELELKRRHISLEQIDDYPTAYFADDSELENAQRMLSRFRTRSKDPRQAAFRYLYSKGYSSAVAQTAIKTHFSAELT